MCFSQFADYSKRPIEKSPGYKSKASKMEHDKNYFGPRDSIFADHAEDEPQEVHTHESENENDDALPVTSKVSLADAWDCRVADLARGTYWDFPKSKHCLPIHD